MSQELLLHPFTDPVGGVQGPVFVNGADVIPSIGQKSHMVDVGASLKRNLRHGSEAEDLPDIGYPIIYLPTFRIKQQVISSHVACMALVNFGSSHVAVGSSAHDKHARRLCYIICRA
jgi:hypothetical protein